MLRASPVSSMQVSPQTACISSSLRTTVPARSTSARSVSRIFGARDTGAPSRSRRVPSADRENRPNV
jgi:hypothetical protein